MGNPARNAMMMMQKAGDDSHRLDDGSFMVAP
jgi:hypothetical protein